MPRPAIWAISTPVARTRSLEETENSFKHRLGQPFWHISHTPQLGIHDRMAWSPGFTRVTLGPTASTTPAPSWPSTAGSGTWVHSPFTTCQSEWQTPLADIFTSTSPGPGLVDV